LLFLVPVLLTKLRHIGYDTKTTCVEKPTARKTWTETMSEIE